LNQLKRNILVIATSSQGRGGIASVLQIHKKYKPELQFIASTPGRGGSLKKLYSLLCALIKFWYYFLFTKIEIIHIHSASYNSFNRKYIFFKIAKLFKKKIIFQIHGAEFHLFFEKSTGKQRKKIKYVLENTDILICLSKEWKLFFESNFNIKRLEILNNVVDYPIEPIQMKSTKPIQFLFLGYIDARKGIWDLCEVIIKHKALITGRIKIRIGGNGQKEKLNSIISTNGLEDIVEYVGWVNAKRKHDLLSNSHVYLLPSYNEGLPISVLEAMSYRMPIISTKVGGIPNVVDAGNGFIINPGDLDGLFGALNTYVKSPGLIPLHGEQSWLKVQSYLPKAVINQLDKIYESI
jgi:glycosyltransferase involved in cell wall biosynthesis